MHEGGHEMTVRQAAFILGLKVRTIREWIRKGKLRAEKGTDGVWRIPEEEIYREEVQERADKARKHTGRA